MASITIGELQMFHAIDREIFSKLVINLRRQVTKSLLVVALLLWLEEAHNCQILCKLSGISINYLDAVANEAEHCINFLKSKISTLYDSSLNLMSKTMGKQITLRTMSETKYTTISGVKAYLNDVCALVFTDILLQVLPTTSNFNPNLPLEIPGFPNPTFGSLKILILPLNMTIPIAQLRGWNLQYEAPIDDRTLFLTFSKGFPVSENEARQFFMNMCGDCIESFQMEIVTNNFRRQALYARMSLRSVRYMDQIMMGKYIARFRSNGKHIWARKFERRDHRKWLT